MQTHAEIGAAEQARVVADGQPGRRDPDPRETVGVLQCADFRLVEGLLGPLACYYRQDRRVRWFFRVRHERAEEQGEVLVWRPGGAAYDELRLTR